MVYVSLGDISGEVKVRSMVDRVPWLEFKCVGTPGRLKIDVGNEVLVKGSIGSVDEPFRGRGMFDFWVKLKETVGVLKSDHCHRDPGAWSMSV